MTKKPKNQESKEAPPRLKVINDLLSMRSRHTLRKTFSKQLREEGRR